MAMKQPHTSIICPKPKNCVSASWDLNSVTEHCLAEVVWVYVVVFGIVVRGEKGEA
jgi:hypothetical protein